MKNQYIKKIWPLLVLLPVFSFGFLLFSLRHKEKPDLTIAGFVNLADGLGRQGPELLKTFKNELKVNFLCTQKPKGIKTPKHLKKYMHNKADDWGKVVVFEDFLWSPSGTTTKKLHDCPKDRVKIAYSMYESTRIPQEWVDILNHTFDAVVIPAPFLKEVYIESGVQIPIFIVPLGLHLDKFLNEPLKLKRQNPMVFSNFSAASDRKNHIALIRAFHKAFGRDMGVFLRINSRFSDRKTRNMITKELATLNYPKNISFTEKSLPLNDYINEFRKTDCYVSPSKGEGFSIQPREAMAMGIPVIATNNTGQIPICESGLVLSVKSEVLELARAPWGDYYGYQFNCDVNDLAEALVEMRDNYEHYLARGYNAREWAEEFQYKYLKNLYRSFISPKKIVLGSKNEITEDYLMTNSKKLARKYHKAFGGNVLVQNL